MHYKSQRIITILSVIIIAACFVVSVFILRLNQSDISFDANDAAQEAYIQGGSGGENKPQGRTATAGDASAVTCDIEVLNVSTEDDDALMVDTTARGSMSWKYLDYNEEPGVGDVWNSLFYDSDNWPSAKGDFAKEGSPEAQSASVVLHTSDNPNKTHYFIHEFWLEDPESVQSIQGVITYKSAVIVYLNGNAIFAGNVPEGGYEKNIDGGAALDIAQPVTSTIAISDVELLESGRNVLAVELHEAAEDGEAYFDFKRWVLSDDEILISTIPSSGIELQKGNEEKEVIINYVSSEDEYFQLFYSEEDVWDEENETEAPESLAESIYMGRQQQADGTYIHTATLRNLKGDAIYYYRVEQSGGEKASRTLDFCLEELE